VFQCFLEGGRGGHQPPFYDARGHAPLHLQSNVLKLPLFSLNWNSLCKIIKIIYVYNIAL
jgi:hypothetical protein